MSSTAQIGGAVGHVRSSEFRLSRAAISRRKDWPDAVQKVIVFQYCTGWKENRPVDDRNFPGRFIKNEFFLSDQLTQGNRFKNFIHFVDTYLSKYMHTYRMV